MKRYNISKLVDENHSKKIMINLEGNRMKRRRTIDLGFDKWKQGYNRRLVYTMKELQVFVSYYIK